MQCKGVQSAPRKWGKATAIEQIKFIAIAFKHLSDPLDFLSVLSRTSKTSMITTEGRR